MNNPYTIRKSPIHNDGMFAKRNIKVGEELPALNYYFYCAPGFNHSCNHNIKIDLTIMKIIAIQDINIGDELTANYGNFKLDCNCQSDNCKSKVTAPIHKCP